MNDTPHFWPEGTGQWDRLARLVLADDLEGATQERSESRNAMLLGTPLQLIAELERIKHRSAATVFLVGEFACDDFASALRDIYPELDVVIGTP
jgi:alkanesulfonate monooxygenase SsuD/methylene tetrahydromethanopterin reductase-like flavin-dependent oxidoreductase (luciferase family)